MAVPTQFPAWMTMAGVPDTLVLDMGGYNAAVAMGYSYTAAATPTQTIAPGETVQENAVTPAQPDTAQIVPLP